MSGLDSLLGYSTGKLEVVGVGVQSYNYLSGSEATLEYVV